MDFEVWHFHATRIYLASNTFPTFHYLWCVQRDVATASAELKWHIKHRTPSGIDSAGFTMFYTNLNSADADARSR